MDMKEIVLVDKDLKNADIKQIIQDSIVAKKEM